MARRRKMTFDEFCAAVTAALDALPESFRQYLEDVVVDVLEEPTAADCAAHDSDEEENVSELLGLFKGVPLTEQHYGDHYPNQVLIFRGPLERVSRSHADLLKNIRATVIHELAHHFGFSEEQLEEFERAQARFLDAE